MSKEQLNNFKAWAMGIACTVITAMFVFYFRADRENYQAQIVELKENVVELRTTVNDFIKSTNQTNAALLKILNSQDTRITTNEVQIKYDEQINRNAVNNLQDRDKEHDDDITFIYKNFSLNGSAKSLH